MDHFILNFFLCLSFFVLFSEASLAQQLVKNGEKVEIDSFKGAKAIKRTVRAGEQIFHFEGEHKGSFVDGNGKKVESSNYENKNGVLVIKKFTEADVGSYSEYPPKIIKTKTEHGFGAVPGPVLQISLS
uniref:Cuticle protein n=1 Tax=Caenorhabditis tropicalis TaxID=1561998 RepID=A0A1I7T312_9PELO